METPVRRLLENRDTAVWTVSPDMAVIDALQQIMTDRHLRHLPVVDDEHVLGVVSIRDVVAHLVRDQEFMIEQLTNYIST